MKFLLDYGFVSSLEESIEKLDLVVFYPNLTMFEVAEEYLENCYDLDSLPEIIQFHIDYEGIARDLELDGTFFQDKSGVFEYLG